MDPPKVRFDPEDFLAPTYWDRLKRGSPAYAKQRGTFAGFSAEMRGTRIDANEWIKAPEFVPRRSNYPQQEFDFDQYNFAQPAESYYPGNAIPPLPHQFPLQHPMLTTSMSIPVQPGQFPFVQQVGNGYSAYVTALNGDPNSTAIILKKRRRRRKKNKNNGDNQHEDTVDIPTDPAASSVSPDKEISPNSTDSQRQQTESSEKPSLTRTASVPDINSKAAQVGLILLFQK
ncbi:unnamed protein product [Bursaphelenchus xylophilus]|uniref:(pine wood nematode) hypothetical protein n=1 Tax=Bursaphelenchus xylophilus TaxID=6326 RepID=A0A1I7SUK8_BURXY|nr:unnamed protein product [Bursaphelenchus xylophilus]CAG9118618.1 unnamed protein product [Bursaphelenchus xylophilus]